MRRRAPEVKGVDEAPRERVVNCPHCNLPAGKIVNGAFVFQARHHGETHHVAVGLEWLRKQLEAV